MTRNHIRVLEQLIEIFYHTMRFSYETRKTANGELEKNWGGASSIRPAEKTGSTKKYLIYSISLSSLTRKTCRLSAGNRLPGGYCLNSEWASEITIGTSWLCY
jgi:hypothetical protein